MYNKISVWAILLVTFTFPMFCQAKSDFKVVFVNPGHPEENATGNFWLKVSRFMDAAANDLNIDLVTIYAHRNHILMKTLADEVMTRQPHYVILVNEKGSALKMIKQITAANIPVFVLLNNINDKEQALLSIKEKQLLYGSLVPDNHIAGKKLLNGLVKMYEAHPDKLDINTPRKLLALQGDYNTPASIQRQRGLTDGLLEYTRIDFIDSTVANWSKQQAYQKVTGILKRSRIDIIWAANDAMAFGAKKAVLESKIDYPIIIGGINWDAKDSHYPVNLSFGGHVTLGALALVMLRDINDNNLPEDKRHQVVNIFESSLGPSYASFNQRLIENKLDNYNFSRFSNSSKDTLPFSIENLTKTFEMSVPNN